MRLRARGLGHAVGHESRWLYRGLALSPEPARITAVVGPNGSGKTTLLRDLAGLRSPSEGEVRLDDRPVQAIASRERAQAVAYLPQTTPLYHDLGALELVLLGRAPYLPRFGAPSRADVERARAALDMVGLGSAAQRNVFSLSGGEYQRVMLARMLATEAPLLILDEPTAALDVGHALTFLELCKQLASDAHTIVLAIHDLELARRYADSAVCLGADTETLACVGPADEVLTPEIIGPIFDVDVAHGADGLVFRPANQSRV